MGEGVVLVEARGGVAHITLNRPGSFNALDRDMAVGLAEAAMWCDSDSRVRAVLLRGAGKAFCAGGDLKDFAARREERPRYLREVTTYLHTAISLFVRMDAPVIAAVQGSAAGAGLSLACACDLVLAAGSARFMAAYTQVGLTPDGSLTYFLPRLVGQRRALELVLTNRVLSAREALDWGLVTDVVPDGDLSARAETLAEQLASGPTGAFGVAKRLLAAGWDQSLEAQMSLETRAIAERCTKTDAVEGMTAFAQKRPPRFEGG